MGTEAIPQPIRSETTTEGAAGHGKVLEGTEQFYRSLIHVIPEGVVLMDLSGRITFVSPQALALYGASSPEEALGTPCLNWIAPESREKAIENIQRLASNLPPAEHEYVLLRKDGTRFHGEITGALLTDDRGNPKSLVTVHRDISGRIEAEAGLQKVAEEIHDLYNNAPCGYHSLDTNGVFLRINDTELAWLGYRREEMIGRMNIKDILTSASRDAFEHCYPEFLKSGTARDMEFDLVRKDGSILPVLLNGSAVRDATGKFLMSRATMFDITVRKQAEAALQKQLHLLEQLIGAIPIPFFYKDLEGRYLGCNSSFAAYTHWNKEGLVGKTVDDIAVPEHSRVYRKADELLFREPGIQAYETQMLSPRGDLHSVVLKKATYKDMDGRVAGIVGGILDITEQKRAEEALRVMTSRYEALLESVPDIIAEVNTDKVYTWVNRAGMEFFGADVVGREASHYFASDQKTYEIVDPLFRGQQEVFYVESPQRRRDGEIRLLAWWCRTLKDPEGRVTGALSTARDITEEKRALEALEASEARFRTLFEQNLDCVFLAAPDGTILDINPAGVSLLGYETKDGLCGTELARLIGDAEQGNQFLGTLHKTGYLKDYEIVLKRRDGTTLRALITCNILFSERGDISGMSGIMRDVSEKRMLEHQLAQAQKMESIGQLAGGVAHDFNNYLTAIIGYADLIRSEIQPGDPILTGLNEIGKAADRAAGLTRQLLAFSRKQVLQPRVLDLNGLVRENARMLGRLLGEDIELSIVQEPNLRTIKADPDQLVQVMMNLAVNARDAMPRGGRLTLKTANVSPVKNKMRQQAVLPAGPYATLTVTDTGTGMDSETLARIFEPFFTTKEKGKGTGLGLSMVYGIIKQSGGFIFASSTPGRGTCFEIYMPAAREGKSGERRQAGQTLRYYGTETILVVEDEEAVRNLVETTLARKQYHVLKAANAGEALLVSEHHRGPIHLLLTDVIMPILNGRELSRRLAALRPEMKVLFMSGYTGDNIEQHGILAPGTELIQKPFSPESLARRIRSILDAPKSG